MKTKRILAGCAALLAITVGMTACGQNKPAATAAAAETTTTAAETTAAETTTAASATEEVTEKTETAADDSTGESAYTVVVVDEDGNPVQNVNVQFCSDEQCLFEKTDADGKAVFAEPEGTYTIHVLKAPDEYEKDSTEYPAPEKYGTVKITLKAASGEEEETAETDETEETEEEASGEGAWDFSRVGIIYDPGAEVEGLKGCYEVQGGIIDPTTNPRLGLLAIYYFAVPEEEFDEFNEYREQASYTGEAPDTEHEGWKENWSAMSAPLLTLVIADGDGEFDPKALSPELDLSMFELVAEEGETKFYFIDLMDEQIKAEYSAAMGEYYEEYETLSANVDEFIANMTFSEANIPQEEAPVLPEAYTFDSADLDGNTLTPADLFADSKVTMVNMWATWCGPCRNELPELGRLAKEFEAKDCRLIGICIDALDEETIGTAKELLAESGCEYTNLCGWETLSDDLPISAFPTTFFVDSEGKLIGTPVIGAKIAAYPEIVDACLAEME